MFPSEHQLLIIQYISSSIIFSYQYDKSTGQKQLKTRRDVLTHGFRGILVHHARVHGSRIVGLLLVPIKAGRQQRLSRNKRQIKSSKLPQ